MRRVFPASAGMIPPEQEAGDTTPGVPRKRGDDPDMDINFSYASWCSPQARG